MQTYLGIVARTTITPHLAGKVESLSKTFLPFHPHVRAASSWRSPSGRVGLWAWDNGPDLWPVGIAESGSQAATLSGYVLSDGRLVATQDLFRHLSDDADLEALGGSFSICKADDSGIRAWNNLARLEQVYWSETDDLTVLSNRALAAHLVARDSKSPVYDRAFLRSILAAGFPTTNQTPFQRTRVLGPGADVVANFNRVRERSRRWASAHAAPDDSASALAKALVQSVAFLPTVSSELKSALTGGKDSRLIAAVLSAAGVPFTALTGGLAEHPDVILAAQVADVLGVNHRRTTVGLAGNHDMPTEVDHHVMADACRRIFGSDATHPAFESISRDVRVPSAAEVVLGGQGGELLRGGYAKQSVSSHRGALRRLESIALKYQSFLTVDAVAAERRRLRRWFVQNAAWREESETLWRYYVEFRAGRWAAAGWAAATIGRPRVWPFFDAAVVRAIGSVPTLSRIDERGMVGALRRLAPDLVDLPLAGSRWQYETGGPADGNTAAWEARSPLTGASGRATFDWRLHFSSGLGSLMAGAIHDINGLDEFVPKQVVERLTRRAISGELDGKRYEGHFLWMLFSVALLISNRWLNPSPSKDTVRFPLPPP